jgi:ketosteroid isomerase-like protein
MTVTPEDALEAYVRASDRHDVDGTTRWIADDAVYLFSNEYCHNGKSAVRNAIEKNFDTIGDGSYSIENVLWLVREPQVAVCVYVYRWSGLVGDERMSGGGRGTTVLRRQNGDWRVVHEHLSRGPLG